MRIAVLYHRYAEEYRALADRLPEGAGREQLLDIAEIWQRLASEPDQPGEEVAAAA